MSVQVLPMQMLIIAILAAIVGFHVSGWYHETKAQYKALLTSQQHERNLLSAMVLASLTTLGCQRAYKAYRRWRERYEAYNFKTKVLYGSAKATVRNRARSALGKGGSN